MNVLKEGLWSQFGASIDMLKNAIERCPEDYWNTNKKFFYNVYHCIVFLDYYLTVPAKKISSPLPFTITGPDQVPKDAIDDVVPDRIYSRQELLGYLLACREKCHSLIISLTEEKLNDRWVEVDGNRNYSVLEILLYNMRHVQHHVAQLNLLLRQGINDAPNWVG